MSILGLYSLFTQILNGRFRMAKVNEALGMNRNQGLYRLGGSDRRNDEGCQCQVLGLGKVGSGLVFGIRER